MLRRLSGSAAAVVISSWWGGGCAPAAPEPTRVPLAEVPPGGRLRVVHADEPIELLRTDQGVEGRLLLCTHLGCEVRWSEAERHYLCPCHEGIYDERGRPLAGPPPRPLDPVAVRVEGGEVWIGAATPESGAREG